MLLNLNGSEAGTNLVRATHVLLLDPLTDSNIDQHLQAIGRAHRLGRDKDQLHVRVVRFVVRKTFEEELHKKAFEDA